MSGFPRTRWVIYGETGSGKSTTAATWPKPMLVACFDPYGKESPYLIKGVVQPITYYEDGTPCRDVLHRETGQLLVRVVYFHDEIPERANAWPRFGAWMNRFNAVERANWCTFVVDSLTFAELVCRKYQEHTLNPEYREPRKWYAQSADRLEEILMMRLGALHDINVVVLAHVSEQFDELHGTHVHRLKAPGRLGMSLPAAYSELYRAYVHTRQEGQQIVRTYALQTRPTSQYTASTSVIVNAPDPCEPRYSAVWANYVPEPASPPPTLLDSSGKPTDTASYETSDYSAGTLGGK